MQKGDWVEGGGWRVWGVGKKMEKGQQERKTEQKIHYIYYSFNISLEFYEATTLRQSRTFYAFHAMHSGIDSKLLTRSR